MVRPHPAFKDVSGSPDEGTGLSIDEPPPNQQPPLARKGKGGDEQSPSSQQPPLCLGGVPSKGERSSSSNQQPPRRKGSDEEVKEKLAAAEMSRVSEMSDYAKRKAALTRKAALAPEASHRRFRESFQNSTASAAVKAKFARLVNGPGFNAGSTADDEMHLTPSLPVSSSEPGGGLRHDKIIHI